MSSNLESGLSAPALPFGIRDMLGELDAYREPPLAALCVALQRLAVGSGDLVPIARFDERRYRRRSLYRGPEYEVLLLCWRAGQRSPIHDHPGSRCAFRVMEGTSAESVFERSDAGLVYPMITREHRQGFVCAAENEDIHQVSNLQLSEDLVTLHVYSPPLRAMNTYSLTDSCVLEVSCEELDPERWLRAGDGI